MYETYKLNISMVVEKLFLSFVLNLGLVIHSSQIISFLLPSKFNCIAAFMLG